ncbi:gliding motility protein RemB [Flavobacterium sp.]|jgi:hypothetical protein|uniref:gliding motility protein RemB n=1 Tax=Flavobacterium sp. TaxID=239 RepID=UPI0037C16D0E
MKTSIYAFLLLFSLQLTAQNAAKNIEQAPVFPECADKYNKELEACFNEKVREQVYSSFKTPSNLVDSNYKGIVNVLFEVDQTGAFIVQYVDAIYPELVQETKRVFNAMDKIKPATYAGNPTYSRYSIQIAIPLNSAEVESTNASQAITFKETRTTSLNELDSMVYKKFNNPQFKSYLNVPFSHSLYAQFDAKLNQIGSNNHTASKPYTYAEVNKYYDFETANQLLMKEKTSWWGRKLWNEYLVEIQGDDYWFTINALFDLRLGKSNPSENDYTYQNTRGIQIQGGLSKKFNFTTTIYESQGRFADYYNQYAESIKPSGGNPAIVPGIGVAKQFKTDSYDFPVAEANLTFAPSQFIDLQLGYGRNFIGDGYRSVLVADGASPYPYFKINATFWKIKYTSTYMWLKDVRDEVTVDGTYATKYMANHYLSWNVSNRLNIGFFESVIWGNTNNRGFDMSFVNPIIFYRAVEISASSKSGNISLGLTSKYKLNNQINLYGQILIDEFALEDVKAANQSWRNKFAFQVGAKYFNAFNVKDLLVQAEYNIVRPYVYSHSDPLTNYGHNNQSMGHNWGANFNEFVLIGRYFKGRWFADAKLTFGERGFDFSTVDDSFNYGGNIYLNYNDDRPFDNGLTVGQGNTTKVFISELQVGYLINPTSNLKLFGSYIYRNFNPLVNTTTTFDQSTNWISIGLRADLFNFYLDY